MSDLSVYGELRTALQALKRRERAYEAVDPRARSTIAITVAGNREYVTKPAAQLLHDTYASIVVPQDKTFPIYFDSKPYMMTAATFDNFMWQLRRILGTNASVSTLASLVEDRGGVLVPAFDPAVTDYTVDGTSLDYVTFFYTLTDSNSSATSSPASLIDVPIPEGNTVVTITVTAENGLNTTKYTITINKPEM